MIINRINYRMLRKYTDVTMDEIDVLIQYSWYNTTLPLATEHLGREIKIHPKFYNPKTKNWNLLNLDKEDLVNFIDINAKAFSYQLIDDINDFGIGLWRKAKCIQEIPIDFDSPHSLRVDNYKEPKDFLIKYQEIKSGDAVKTGKPIKILKKLKWLHDVSDKTYEEFNNFLKARYNSAIMIREVEGEEIRKWYHYREHSDRNTGTLGDSCMRHSRCQDYLDIYTENNVRMIIATIENRLVGRAIIWPKEIWNKNYFDDCNAIVDRIYGVESTIEEIKQYCKKKLYVTKYKQSYQDSLTWVHWHEGEEKLKSKKIRLNISTEHDYYPYMDTFKFCNLSGYISNSSELSYDYELTDTDGYNSSRECYNCGCSVPSDDECVVHDNIYCRECCIWVEAREAYYLEDDCVYSEVYSEYIHVDDATQTYNEQWINADDAVDSINNEYVGGHESVLTYKINGEEKFIDENCCNTFKFKINNETYYYSKMMNDESIFHFLIYLCDMTIRQEYSHEAFDMIHLTMLDIHPQYLQNDVWRYEFFKTLKTEIDYAEQSA